MFVALVVLHVSSFKTQLHSLSTAAVLLSSPQHSPLRTPQPVSCPCPCSRTHARAQAGPLLTSFSFRDNTGIAVGTSGTVLRFSMQTLQWDSAFAGPSPSPAPNLSAVFVYSSNRVLVGGDGGYLAETFPGATGWSVSYLPLPSSPPSPCSIRSLSISGLSGVVFSSPFGPSPSPLPAVEETWAAGCGALWRRAASSSSLSSLSSSVLSSNWTIVAQAGVGVVPAGVEFYAVLAHKQSPYSGAIAVGSNGTILR